jgi:hypothetical protein
MQGMPSSISTISGDTILFDRNIAGPAKTGMVTSHVEPVEKVLNQILG